MSETCTHECSTCSEKCSNPESLLEPQNSMSEIKNVYAVVSGKGGVGKSLVTSMLATLMRRKNFDTAVLDADITGPSVPKIFGTNNEKAMGSEDGIFPVLSRTGIELMSINYLLENETDPVLWRGPVIAGTVKQFWTDVIWGSVDYMFVDMPPGTGDVPLTVFQSLPLKGIIIVTSPQELVSVIVEKAVKMARTMKIPVIGIVENMSYFECPECRTRHSIFGDSHIDEIAGKYGIDAVAKLPVDSGIALLCDSGKIEDFEGEWLEAITAKIEKISGEY